MEMYGIQAPDFFHVDDLLDFSNDDLFSSTTTTTDSDLPPLENPKENFPSAAATTATTTTNPNSNPNRTSNFADDLCVPSDDVAELEWLSNFVDESFSDFPMTDFTGNMNLRYDASVTGKARSKRSRIGTTNNSWISSPESDIPITGKSKQGSSRSNNNYRKKESSSSISSVIVAGDQSPPSSASSSGVRRCTHCASEKTPQWRTGPMGPKTLCNACGVRYKSGRLVPEYRPAASPTFVLTQHSNSHRKVMELRRQKEVIRQESNRHEFFHHDFKVC